MHHPSRGGVRGGKDQFEWESVKTDKHRENYLGHSLMAPVGRWQKGKDLTWYAKDKETKIKQQQIEKNKIKQLEEEAMAAALGFGTIKKRTTALTKQEIAETLKRGQTERDSGNVERVEGMGFGCSRAAMMDSTRSNDGFVKEPEVKLQQVQRNTQRTPSKEKSDDDNNDEHKRRKKKKKQKLKKSEEPSKDEKRRNFCANTRNRESGSDDSGDSDTQNTSSRNKYKELKRSRKREKTRSNESEDEHRSRRKDKYKELPLVARKRKQRHDSSSSDNQNRRSRERERRTNRRRERHDSD